MRIILRELALAGTFSGNRSGGNDDCETIGQSERECGIRTKNQIYTPLGKNVKKKKILVIRRDTLSFSVFTFIYYMKTVTTQFNFSSSFPPL